MDPRDPRSGGPLPVRQAETPDSELANEPPVVARLIVEIRSDGTTTVARGAMEDAQSGQKVAILARGTTPLALALSLARSITAAPWLSGAAKGALKLLGRGRSR
jgi:hypothetical protein